MSKDTIETSGNANEMGLSLEELIRRGARELIQKAIEVEVQELLAEYGNVKMLGGRRAVVRNGYLPEREILTPIGAIPVRVPKVRDRAGAMNCVSRATFLGLAFKLVQEAEKSWRRIRGVDRLADLLNGMAFKDGVPVPDSPLEAQRLAA